jgi:hypothetical protein
MRGARYSEAAKWSITVQSVRKPNGRKFVSINFLPK